MYNLNVYILAMSKDIRLTLYTPDPDKGQTDDEPRLLRDAVARLSEPEWDVPTMRERAGPGRRSLIREVLVGATRDPDALASLVDEARDRGVHLRDVVAERLR